MALVLRFAMVVGLVANGTAECLQRNERCMDSLVDDLTGSLFNNVLNKWALHRDLENTTLEKSLSHISKAPLVVLQPGLSPSITRSALPISSNTRFGQLSRSNEFRARQLITVKSSSKDLVPLSDKKAGNALWRVGWLSWWSQVILTVVSSTMLIFASLMAGGLTLGKALANGALLSAMGIGFSGFGIIQAWLYTQFGRGISRMRENAPSGERVVRTLRRGVILHLVGMFVTLLSAEQLVGSLLSQSLTAFSSSFRTSNANVFATSPLTPVDIFVVQANTNILLSHFAGLAFSTWLLWKDDSRWSPKPPAPLPAS